MVISSARELKLAVLFIEAVIGKNPMSVYRVQLFHDLFIFLVINLS